MRVGVPDTRVPVFLNTVLVECLRRFQDLSTGTRNGRRKEILLRASSKTFVDQYHRCGLESMAGVSRPRGVLPINSRSSTSTRIAVAVG